MNVAIAAARLDAPAAFFGGLSTDLFGDMLRAALTASGVDLTYAATTERPTTLAFVNFDGGDARYAFFDENSAGRMLTENDLPAFAREVAALHFGSFSLASEPCGSAFEALMQREQQGRVISLDVNVRPSLIRNRDGYLARIARLVAMSDIVKLSTDDLAWLAPDVPFREIAERWLASGASLVVLTRGAEGAVAVTRSARAETPGIAVTFADTIGAGDTFTGAMLARLRETEMLTKPAVAGMTGEMLAELLAFAVSAAAITVSRPGADPPWRRELP
jgi:fructokinase